MLTKETLDSDSREAIEILHASVKNISDHLRNLLLLIEEIEDIENDISPGDHPEGGLLPRIYPELKPDLESIEKDLTKDIRRAWLSTVMRMKDLAQDKITALFEPEEWQAGDPLGLPQDFNVVYEWLKDMGTLNRLQKGMDLQVAITRIRDTQEYLSTLLKLTQGWAVDIPIKKDPIGTDSDTPELFAEYSDSFMSYMTNAFELIPHLMATHLMAGFFLDNKEFMKPLPEPWNHYEKISRISRGLIEGYFDQLWVPESK